MSNTDKNINKKGLGRGLNSLFGDVVSGPLPQPTVQNGQVGASSTANTFNPPTIVIQKPKISEDFIEGKKEASSAAAIPEGQRIHTLAIEKISPHAEQPRSHFDPEKLKELADSIKAQGVLQPILVRRKDNGFQIIAGERRWRAAQIAGLHEIPAIIKTSDDKKTLEWALIENIQRADLNPIEEAEAYQELIKKYNLSHAEVADQVGKDRVTITNSLRLLQLEESVREKMVLGEISTGHAKVLLTIPEKDVQAQWAAQVAAKKLSVRALEKLLILNKGRSPNSLKEIEKVETSEKDKLHQLATQSTQKELEALFGTKVQVDQNQGQGFIKIAFYSDEQFNQIVDKMRAGQHVRS